MALLNRAAMTTTTTGTGSSIALVSAVDVPLPMRGFDTLADAGATDGMPVSYWVQDGAAWEYGAAVYSSSGPSLTSRSTDRSSDGAGVPINLSGNAQVFIGPLARDFWSRDINPQTGTSYTFQASDASKLVTFNNAAEITATIPTGLPANIQIDCAQIGAGSVKFIDAYGVTVISPDDLITLRTKGSGATLVHLGSDVWLLSGDIAGFPRQTSVSYVSEFISASAGTSHNSGTIAFGDEADDRQMVAAIATRKTDGAVDISSVTIGGVTATELLDVSWASDQDELGFWMAHVPDGTDGQAVVNYSGSVARVALQLFRVVGLRSLTPYHTASNITATDPIAATINVPRGGCAIAVGVSVAIGATATWSGLTKAEDTSDGSTGISISSAIIDSYTDISPSASCDWSTSTTPALGVISLK